MSTGTGFVRRIGVPAAAEQHDATPEQSHPLRVLVVEDNLLCQQLLLALLGHFGHRTEVVSNGREALDALQREPYHLVLMDVQMPEMDGLETSRRIRQGWSDAARPRVLALTANVMPEDWETCLKAGMDDYLAKPVQVAELKDALRRAGEWHFSRTGLPDSCRMQQPQ